MRCEFTSVQPLLFLGKTGILIQHANSLFLVLVLMLHCKLAWNGPTRESVDMRLEYLITNVRWFASEIFLFVFYLGIIVLQFHAVQALYGTRQSLNLRCEVFFSWFLSSCRTWKLSCTVTFFQSFIFEAVKAVGRNMCLACTFWEFRLKWFLFLACEALLDECGIPWLLLLKWDFPTLI